MGSFAAATGWPSREVWNTPWGDLEQVAAAMQSQSGKPYSRGLLEHEVEQKRAAQADLRALGIIKR